MTTNYTAPLSLISSATSQPKWLSTSLDKVLSAIGVNSFELVITSPVSTVPPVDQPEPPASQEESLDLLAFSGDPADSGTPPIPTPDPPTENVLISDPDTYTLKLRLEALSEIVIDLPGLDGVSLVLNPGGFEAHLMASGDDLSLGFTVGLGIRLSPNLLRPVRSVTAENGAVSFENDPSRLYVQITLASVTVTIDATGAIDISGGVGVQIDQPMMIGDTGVVIESADIDVNFSGSGARPAGTPAGWKGLLINQASVRIPSVFSGAFTATGLGIGSGGVSGTIGATFALTYANGSFTGDLAGGIFGMPGGLESVSLTLQQNIPSGGGIKAKLLLPFFDATDNPLDIDIGFSASGAITVAIGSPNGILTLTKPNLLSLQLDSIGFELKDGLFVAKLSGQLTPLFGADQGLNWPGFKVEELSIDSKGHVHLQGGWLALREQYNLDFHGFHVGITKLGFGKTEDGGKWVGFSGELKLVDGFTAGASVEGLRVTWYEDGRDPKISFNGIGVEFEIPDVLTFKGYVAYRELEVNGASVHRFDGDIKLNLISLKLEIDAKLVVGSASGGPEGNYNFFAIYLGVELPTGIPLSPTPLALYGMAGLFALQMEPDKWANEEWYEGWFKRPDEGITDLAKKWVNRRGSLAFGVGATIGTGSDNAFTFSCKALLVIVFPGPIILLEGKANLLKERAKLNDDPMFRTLAVLDMRQGQILMGLAAKYKQDESGKVIDIVAGAEAFFGDPGNWHIYMGEKEPRAKRIRARILSLFEANSYFMIDPKKLATGAWVGYARAWKFGPVSLTLEAWLEGNVVVNWTPLHFHGDLWLHGNVEVKVFGFGLGLSVDARFEADVFDPFHVRASFEVSVKLPKPLKKKHFEITLEWGPIPNWPERLPLPLKEVAIEHFKVTTSWPLRKDSTPPLLLPRYDPDKEGLRGDYPPPTFSEPPISAMPVVPLDGRAHISFGRAVHDKALVGVNPQPVQPAYERVGDPDKDEGPVTVRYGLSEIELAKWDQHINQWKAVASAPAVSGVPALYGSWAAVPQLPSGTGQAPIANVKLWLWSKTPFDYTRHGGGDWDNWFIGNEAFANYPCVPQDIPDREVCVDFETLSSSQWLQSPWQVPQHPEITLGWQAPPRQQVTALDSPFDGFTQALSFPPLVSACLPPPPADLNPIVSNPIVASGASGRTLPNTVTIKLTTPGKQVKLWIIENKPEQVCLDFRNRPKGNVKLPLIEQGANFGAGGSTNIASVKTTLGDLMGLDCTATALGPMRVALPCPARTVELMLTYQPVQPGLVTQPPKIEAYNSAGEKLGEKSMINPAGQPEIVRFEGNDLKEIKINSGNVRLYLHKLCFLCPATSATITATAFDADGKQIGTFVNQGNVLEIVRKNLTRIELNSKSEIRLLKICALFPPDPREVVHRQEMENHLKSEVARWSKEGEVLEPFSAYRLKIVTTIDAYGEGKLSGSSKNLTQTEYAYFRTEGPPGLTKLSLPAGREADKFDSGLEDLKRYVSQTMPATVPKEGEKPVMAKPFYGAYDIGVDFNEDYVDLMYRISGRDLGLYIYDNNNRPVRDAEGRLLIQSGDWGAVEELTLTEGEQHWVALSNSANRCLPEIDQDSIVHDKKLTSAIAERVLEPDTVYEARLIPLLLRESFRNYLVGSQTQGPSGKLGRWEVHDEGASNTPSSWEPRETGTPPVRYMIQTSSIKGGPDDAADPFKPGTMLVFGNDPAMDAGHSEQPFNWTDYRLSVYLSASGGGAMGLVFRYGDLNNYYRFSLDRNGQYRRLVSVANGINSILAQDDFTYESQFDYLVTVEAIGNAVRIYQDGALIFDVTDAAHSQGAIGLYCNDNPSTWFNDVRVDDFRQTAPVVYRFNFTTSLFANFFHHLHSYQDETWRVAVEDVPDAYPAMAKAATPTTQPTEDEARAYETLATTLLGPAARRNPPEVQVSRVEIDGTPLAFLLQSPEPIDWLRTEIALSQTSFARTEPALPGEVKLAAVNFAANRIDIDSVVLLLREPIDLSAYRIEGRLVTWPLSPGWGVVIDAHTLPGEGLAPQPWTTYRTFEAETSRSARTILQVQPGDALSITPAGLAGVDAAGVDTAHRILYSIELRLVAPNGRIVHSRHFLPDDDYVSEYVKVLRKADGTGCFMIKLDVALNAVPLSLEQYRLKLTYHRDNRTRVPTSQIWSQAGNDAEEIVTLDIPLQTQ